MKDTSRNKLQSLLIGGYSSALFEPSNSTLKEPLDVSSAMKIAVLLYKDAGIVIKNPEIFLHKNAQCVDEFAQNLIQTLKDDFQFDATIMRKSFFDSGELDAYTDEDYQAIFAQYAITYGWEGEYLDITGVSAQDVYFDYIAETPHNKFLDLSKGTTKEITVWDTLTLSNKLRNIIGSARALNAHELQVIENSPLSVLSYIFATTKIAFFETKIKVATIIKEKSNGEINHFNDIINSANDIVKYVGLSHLTPKVEGQITKTDLKNTRISIPSSVRKTIVKRLNDLATDNINNVTEEMIKYENFWKRLDKFLRWDKLEKRARKYPDYTACINKLYNPDRSWTFNSRYETAKSSGDYASAISILSEKPGMLMRNILEFIRMSTGTTIPQKVGNDSTKKVITADAKEFFESTDFDETLKRTNVKGLWDVLKELSNKSNYESKTERFVQGVLVNYSQHAPYPALDSGLAKIVKAKVKSAIKTKNRSSNEGVGKVFLDKGLKNYVIPTTDRNNTNIAMSGSILTTGTKITIPDSVNFLRVGVMWRGSSTDLDLSTIFKGDLGQGIELSYRRPEVSNQGKLMGVSSGDVTWCDEDNFSSELIEVDLNNLGGIESFYNDVVTYSGSRASELESYFFIQFIDKLDVYLNTRELSIELDKVDYAVKIENDGARQNLGVMYDVKKSKVTVLNTPNTFTNSQHSADSFSYVLNMIESTIGSMISARKMLKMSISKEQLVDNPEDADIVISDSIDGALHPTKDVTEIQKLVF